MTAGAARALIPPEPYDFKLEREFEAWIIDLAEWYGWRAWSVGMPMRPAGRGRFVPDKRGSGLPDLVMIHDDPARMVLAEVKLHAALSDDQRAFLRLARGVRERIRDGLGDDAPAPRFPLQHIPLGVYAWRWPSSMDTIVHVLSGTVLL